MVSTTEPGAPEASGQRAEASDAVATHKSEEEGKRLCIEPEMLNNRVSSFLVLFCHLTHSKFVALQKIADMTRFTRPLRTSKLANRQQPGKLYMRWEYLSNNVVNHESKYLSGVFLTTASVTLQFSFQFDEYEFPINWGFSQVEKSSSAAHSPAAHVLFDKNVRRWSSTFIQSICGFGLWALMAI